MAYDPIATVELRALNRLAIFRWSPDVSEHQPVKPVVAGVTYGEAQKAFLDFVLVESCKRPPSGWKRVTYRGPFRTPPPGIDEIPRDFLDVSSSISIVSGTTVEEVRRVLSRRIALIISRETQESFRL